MADEQPEQTTPEATPAAAAAADEAADAAQAEPAAGTAATAGGTAAEVEDDPPAEQVAGKAAQAADETTDTAADQTADNAEDEPARVSRFGPMALAAIGVTGLVVVASVTSAVFFAMKYQSLKETQDAKDQARQAACDFGKAMVTYDYNQLEPFFQKIEDASTDKFKSFFQAEAQRLKQDLVDNQIKSTADTAECGVKSGDKNTVDVVTSFSQTVSSVATKGQQWPLPPNSMVVTVEKRDGKWLVSDVIGPNQGLPGQ